MKRGIVLTFLLVLFLVPVLYSPVNLALSSDVLPPLAEPNMQEDFVMSADGDESTDSITSFSETLADDVLYYPDAFLSDYPIMATAGVFTGTGEYNTWENTTSDTATFWNGDPDADEELIFVSDHSIEYFNYMTKIGAALGQDPDLMLWNFTGSAWVKIEDIANTAWYNDTVTDSCFWNSTNHIRLQIDNDADDAAKWYYAELNFCTMLLADSDHYAESFTDVSEWILPSSAGIGATMTTDGDVATITENGPASLGVAYTSFDPINYFEYYYEFRIETMTATTAYLVFWDSAVLVDYIEIKTFTSAGTYKGIISDIDAEATESIGFVIDSNNDNILVDYLRISKSNETGWQHDGSTTEGVTNDGDVDKNYTSSSDGDILTFGVDHTGATGSSYVYIKPDTTTTVTDIERDYYPFIAVRYRMTVYGDLSSFSINYATDGRRTTITTNTNYQNNTWVIARLNHKVGEYDTVGSYGYYVYALSTTDGSYVLETDWVKAYGIADYTYTGTGVSLDDVLYVDSGILYCSGTSFTSIVLDYDPSLSFDTTRSMWTMITSSGIPQIDFYITDWLGYTSDTSGSFPSGTLTDLRIKFTDSANIESITFVSPIPQWNNAGTAILIFAVLYDPWGINVLLIFFGLCLIPISVIYLVKGGKNEMSMDKVFYGIVVFILGWALFLGGIFA